MPNNSINFGVNLLPTVTNGSLTLGDANHKWKGYINLQNTTIPYAQVDSASTATVFTATVDGITELHDGVAVLLKNGVVTSASGFTININNLGAKPAYSNMAAESAETTIFNINYTMLFIYDSTRVTGGCWICYRGYDSNTNTIGYQLRTNSTLRPTADKGYRYRLWFTSLDGTAWVPANKSTSTNATASRTPNTRVIDPFGEIIYYSPNETTDAGVNLSATTCWTQYVFSLGYSFNATGAALTLTNPAPVYIKCTPQTAGGAVLNGYTQALPSSNDGYIYIFLGMAYSATGVELAPEHPVYWHDGTGIRLWTGAVPTKLPSVTSSDNGKVLSVASGTWSANTLAAATTSANGLMSSTDKTKLDEIEIATISEIQTYFSLPTYVSAQGVNF